MIRRLYINNFGCLENFDLSIAGQSSVLLIGKNGSGKTTVSFALEVLQKIARGTNLAHELIKPSDFFLGRTEAPLRFEIEVEIGEGVYEYALVFEFRPALNGVHIVEERLLVDGQPVYWRPDEKERPFPVGKADAIPQALSSQTKTGFRTPPPRLGDLQIDSRRVALPILYEQSQTDPLFIFKQWLSRMLILRPTPALIGGESGRETLQPGPSLTDFASWFSGLLAYAPGAYSRIERYLKQVIPDFHDIKNPSVGKDARNLAVQFTNGQGNLVLDFEDLSDGEKCFMICAVVLASNETYGPLLCFWDEPDNYLAPSEVGHFVMDLRKAFQSGGQFIATSHNPEAILQFSDENTFVLHRKSHLEPTIVRPLSELQVGGDLVTALITGDLEP